ncbi:MAG: hypothetical protein P9F75_17610 [Candidatus Contendobacter sp.]|nr:hypothetical protein [Candidatus Contendobacter sp.]
MSDYAASGGRESAVSEPAAHANALPDSAKQGADATRSPKHRAAPARALDRTTGTTTRRTPR